MAKILIVDDEPRIRELIREHLQYAGYVCEEAGDGSAALSLLSGGGYDLVILDLMMPFMDGMTCLREMRNRHINTPVIILTARGEEYDKLAGLEGGADDYVVKPFSPRELVARVRAVLNRTMPSAGRRSYRKCGTTIISARTAPWTPMSRCCGATWANAAAILQLCGASAISSTPTQPGKRRRCS